LGRELAENVRKPSYDGGRGIKLLKKRHMIFERFLMAYTRKGHVNVYDKN